MSNPIETKPVICQCPCLPPENLEPKKDEATIVEVEPEFFQVDDTDGDGIEEEILIERKIEKKLIEDDKDKIDDTDGDGFEIEKKSIENDKDKTVIHTHHTHVTKFFSSGAFGGAIEFDYIDGERADGGRGSAYNDRNEFIKIGMKVQAFSYSGDDEEQNTFIVLKLNEVDGCIFADVVSHDGNYLTIDINYLVSKYKRN